MSNRNVCLTSFVYVILVVVVPALLSSPLVAGRLAPDPGQSGSAVMSLQQISAIAPSADDTTASEKEWFERGSLSLKMIEARAVLEDLRTFAGSAQQAIRMGEKIQELRLENKRLREGIAAIVKDDEYPDRHLAEVEVEMRRLTETVVANWILTLKLNHQASAEGDRLIAVKSALAKTEAHLASLRKQLAERRSAAHNLRAERAALAADIGRTKRQIINSNKATHRTEDHHRAIETTIRQLRHVISAKLRSLLAEH